MANASALSRAAAMEEKAKKAEEDKQDLENELESLQD